MKCKICATGEYQQPEGKEYGVCNICGSSIIYYKPLPHQILFHNDTHTMKALFGAYGSGKSTTATLEYIKHILSIPDGLSAMLAPTMKMLEETSYKMLKKYLPHTFIEKEVNTRGQEALVLKNGHRILRLPSNDPDKIRSLNLTGFYLEEASNSKLELYSELVARTRSEKAFIYGIDPETGEKEMEWSEEAGFYIPKIVGTKLLGIICSNPDVGWIRTEILNNSDQVFAPDDRKYPRDPLKANPDLSTHLHASTQNVYLDPGFVTRMSRGKPDWWVQRYIYGSFDYSEGAVYPEFTKAIVDPFPVPKNWKRLYGVDFGLRDPTVMLEIAIDPGENIAYITKEHYESEQPVNHHAKRMKEIMSDAAPGMILRQPIADPAGNKRSGVTKRSYFDHYAEYGIWFQPGNNSLDAGIAKVYTYFALGKLKIFSSCINTIKEGREYKYKENELDEQKNRGEKPIDANNHAMDALRYVVMELPDDPENLSAMAYEGNMNSLGFGQRSQSRLPHALQDNVEPYMENWYTDY